MKQLLFLFSILALLSSCGSSKKASQRSKPQPIKTTKSSTVKTTKTAQPVSEEAASIVKYAKRFEGTKYKYGGTTKKGMDCSGLIYTSFGAHDIEMPRTTSELSKTGDWIDIKKVATGDLVFFATKKNSRRVNHVGIVTDVDGHDFSFIHSSSSRGVMISKLSNRYWYQAYVQARRYL